MEDVVARPVGSCKVEDLRLAPDGFQAVGIFPGLGTRNVVRDSLFDEPGPGPVLHRPVIPFFVKVVEVDKARVAKFEAAYFLCGRTRAGVVPRTDDQVVPRSSAVRTLFHVPPIIRQRPGWSPS